MHTLRASAFGSCVKAQAALLLGYEAMLPSEKMQAIYDRGHDHEDANLAAMQAAGWSVFAEQEEVSLVFADYIVTGHLDGKTRWHPTETPFVWESKSPGAWTKFEKAYKTADWSDPLAHRYAWQISVYMLALNMEAMVTCLDDTGTVQSFVIETPPFIRADIEQRLGEIAAIVDSGVLPQECSSNDYPCPVAYLHETPELDADPILDKMVADYWFAAKMLKEWKAKQDAAKKKIQTYVGVRDRTETETSLVTVYEQAGPATWDTDRMILDGIIPDLYRTPGASSTRIKITKKEGIADVENDS